jgi:hypothetical protein
MEAPTTRTCKKCGETKDFKLFAEALMCNFGRSHVCKKCNAEKHREYRKLRVKKPKKPKQVKKPVVERICKACEKTKPLELFTEAPKYKFGRSYTCKKCTEKKDTDRSLIKYYKLKSKKAKLQIISKTCRVCKETKELELFEKDKKCKFGRKSICKKCVYNYNRKNYQLYYKFGLRKPKEHEEQPVTKTCRVCKETKDFELFKLHKPAKFGRATICKKCHNEKSKKYGKTEKGKEKTRISVKRYYSKNKTKIAEKDKKFKKEQVRNIGIVYLKTLVAQKLNIPASKVTDKQMHLQRESILLHRELEKLKQQIL